MKRFVILAALLLAICSSIAPNVTAEAMPTVKFTSGGELVVTDSAGLVHAFDAAGQPISVEGETAFRYFDRTLGGTQFDIRKLDGTWLIMDQDDTILYNKIIEQWTDSIGITACLIETETEYQYIYFDYGDSFVAQRTTSETDFAHYLGLGTVFFENTPSGIRLFDVVSGREDFLPFCINPDTFDARIPQLTGRAMLTCPASKGALTVFIDAEMNKTIVHKMIYPLEDEVTGALYLLEYEDSGTILYDAYENQIFSSDGIICSICNGIITEEIPQGYRLYTTDGKLFLTVPTPDKP